MLPMHLSKPDAGNLFHDLSGISSSASSNPYDALIIASANDPVGPLDHYVSSGTKMTLIIPGSNPSPL